MKKRLSRKAAWAAVPVLAMTLWLGGCAASANHTVEDTTAAGTVAVTESAAVAEATTPAITETATAAQNPASTPETTAAAGGGASGQETEWIGEDRAREIALGRAEGTNPNVYELYQDWDDGRTVYEGEMVDDSYRYDFEIDAATGDVLKWERENRRTGEGTQAAGGSSQGQTGAENAIGTDAASSIALEKAQGTDAWIVEIGLDRDDGRLVYEGEMRDSSYEYDFEIDAQTGEVLQWEVETLRR